MPHEETRDELAKIKQERDELKSECERLDSLYRRECAAYQKLANSKFGRLTLAYWRSAFAYRDISALKGGAKIPNGYSIDHFNYEDFGCGSGICGMWSRAIRRLSRQLSNSAKERNNGQDR